MRPGLIVLSSRDGFWESNRGGMPQLGTGLQTREIGY